MKENRKKIGKRLEIFINSNNIKQLELAKKIGKSHNVITNYKSGKNPIPIELVIELEKYGLNAHWLLTGKGDMMIPEGEKSLPIVKEFNQVLEFAKEKFSNDAKKDKTYVLNYFEMKIAELEHKYNKVAEEEIEYKASAGDMKK